MQLHIKATRAVLIAATCSALAASRSAAQGCEPIRFTTPINLGGEGQAYQPASQWQVTVAYRGLVSKEWFVGTRDQSALAPGGQSPIIRVHTFVADVAYSINDRYRLRLSVPVSSGSMSRMWPDKAIHEQTATGIGDVSLMGEAWLLAPRTHSSGNIALGFGLKAPTGSHMIGSKSYSAAGAVDFPADQTIQPSDGGWGVLLEGQAFRQITRRTYGYASGSYMMSPRAHSNAQLAPTNTTYWSVPDVYSARLGSAFALLPDHGVAVSLGARVDGIPVHDLIGGGDDSTIKRTSYVVFADPGLSLTRGKGTLTLNVPYRLRVNRMKSVLEQNSTSLNGGGFAKYVVFASYSYRF